MVKILHTIPALDGGGADRVIFDYCVRMIPDLEFDFIVHSENKGILEDDLLQKGCKIFHIRPARDGLLSYCREIYRILKKNHYDMIHVSQGFWGFIYIFLARVAGIKVRIAHAHMANVPETRVQMVKRKIFSKLTILCSTDLFACGLDAARWMWGEPYLQQNKVKLMPNAIDGPKFVFDPVLREELRQKWGMDSNFVIGNVGRLAYQKNQSFLIDVFKEVVAVKPTSRLVLIGRGELEKELKTKVEQMELSDFVHFTGVRNDVHELLNMMDVFVLPSHFEGLPITLIEVQMNGLPTVVSDKITTESKFSENYDSVPLEESPQVWAKRILSFDKPRAALASEIQEQRDVNYLASIQKDWYLKRMEKL